MNGLRRLNAIATRIEDGAAGLLMAVVLAIVVNELTLRTLVGKSNLWTDELARVLLIAMTYISAVGLTRDGAHVHVEMLVDRLRPALRMLVERLCDAFCLGFALVATWLGYKYVAESALFGISFAHSDLPFPIWVAQSIVPIGFGLISLRLALRLFGVRPEKPAASAEV